MTTRATQKEQATTTHDFEKKFIDIFRTFYQRKLRLSFLDWEPKCGDSIHQTVFSIATGLESLKSLASDRASFLDSISPIGGSEREYIDVLLNKLLLCVIIQIRKLHKSISSGIHQL